jgi:RloB-like protein
MSKRKRPTPTTIFIACEGTNTERIYFEFISEQIQEEQLFAIKVYPDETDKNPKTNALNLVREAQKQIEFYDEVWVVFDKDGDTQLEEASNLAKEEINDKKVNIAFSSIAFEHWFLLHFEKNKNAFGKSDCTDEKDDSLFCGRDNHTKNCAGSRCVAGRLREQNFIKDYTKRARNRGVYKIAEQLLDKDKILLSKAIENAAWLRFKQKENLRNNAVYEINPYTDVDVLVKRLFGIENVIDWANFGETIDLGKCEVKADLHGNELLLKITNKKDTTLFSTELKCFVIDSNSNTIECEIERVSLNPNNEKTITVEKDFSNVSFVKLEFEGSIYFLEL